MENRAPSRLAARTAVAVGLLLLLAACASGNQPAATTTSATTQPRAGATTTVGGQSLPGLGPERVPIPAGPPLGPVLSDRYGPPIDGIQCQASEQVVYHIHAHLTVFVDGQPRQVPFGIGIGPPIQVTGTPAGGFVSGGGCFYWLHTHAGDGIVHIESPSQQLYTLGQFFDVWGQSLAPDQVGAASGALTMYVNQKPYTGNPRDIQLTAHGEIQLDIGTVVPPTSIDWSQTGL